jgi:hypothetical protein
MDIKIAGKHHSKAYLDKLGIVLVSSALTRNFHLDGYQIVEIINIGEKLVNINQRAIKSNSISIGQYRKKLSLLACLQAVLNDHYTNRRIDVGYVADSIEFGGFSFGLFLKKDATSSPSADLRVLDSFVYVK